MRRPLVTLLLFALALATFAAEPIRVACVGNSITYGYGLPNPATDSYPAQLQQKLGKAYDVRNFGHSGATLLSRGHRPYIEQEAYKNALAFKPDIVVIHLGINDTDPRNWPFFRDDFTKDYTALIRSFKAANPKAAFYIAKMSPISHRHHRFLAGTRDWHKLIQAAIERVAKATDACLIDFYKPLLPFPQMFPDGLHPNKAGAGVLARVVYEALTGDYGGLQMPLVFSDNMVVSRNRNFEVYGTANAGQRVVATFNNEKSSTVAQNDGTWRIVFAVPRMGKPYTLTVTSQQRTLRFKNIVAGEVWLCSGQSNMAFPLANDELGKEALTIVDDPNLRVLNFLPRWETNDTEWPQSALDSTNNLQYMRCNGWQQATSNNMGEVSAVAYYFAKVLRSCLGVPVGIIVNAVGGSPTEAWIDRQTLEDEYPELLNDRFKDNVMVMPWVVQRMRKNIARTTDKLQMHPYQPTYLYDAAIRPLAKFPINGVIWYQGESNAENMEIHERLFPLLLSSWRTNWDNPQLPVYMVQLSSINRPSWPWFRNSQRVMANTLPYVYMAVSSDVGDSLDVHPRQKYPVGKRLANLALYHQYDFKQLTPCGPSVQSATMEPDGEVRVYFNWDKGLKTADGKALRTFEVAGYDEVFYPAEATIKDREVRLTCPQVPHPAFVRYGWQPFTRANLVNGDGFPASTFRVEVKR